MRGAQISKVYVARMLERYFLRRAASATVRSQPRSMNWLSPVVRVHTWRCSVGQPAVIGRRGEKREVKEHTNHDEHGATHPSSD